MDYYTIKKKDVTTIKNLIKDISVVSKDIERLRIDANNISSGLASIHRKFLSQSIISNIDKQKDYSEEVISYESFTVRNRMINYGTDFEKHIGYALINSSLADATKIRDAFSNMWDRFLDYE